MVACKYIHMLALNLLAFDLKLLGKQMKHKKKKCKTKQNNQSAPSFASLTSKSSIAQPSQQQGTAATPSILSNVSCLQVTRDTGKKRAADSDVLQSMVSTTKSMRSFYRRIVIIISFVFFLLLFSLSTSFFLLVCLLDFVLVPLKFVTAFIHGHIIIWLEQSHLII